MPNSPEPLTSGKPRPNRAGAADAVRAFCGAPSDRSLAVEAVLWVCALYTMLVLALLAYVVLWPIVRAEGACRWVARHAPMSAGALALVSATLAVALCAAAVIAADGVVR